MTSKRIKMQHLLMALLFSCTALLSQAQGPGGPGPDPDPNPNPNIPFDGGISLVVAAGIAYAAKKGYDKRKKKNHRKPAKD